MPRKPGNSEAFWVDEGGSGEALQRELEHRLHSKKINTIDRLYLIRDEIDLILDVIEEQIEARTGEVEGGPVKPEESK